MSMFVNTPCVHSCTNSFIVEPSVNDLAAISRSGECIISNLTLTVPLSTAANVHPASVTPVRLIETVNESPLFSQPPRSDSIDRISNVHITNLPEEVDDVWLRNQFSRFGLIVSVKAFTSANPYTRNYGFVQYTAPFMAHHAAEAMDGQRVAGCTLSVRLAARNKDKGSTNAPNVKLQIANLPPEFDSTNVRALLSNFGELRAKSPVFEAKNRDGSIWVVRFRFIKSASAAVEQLNGRLLVAHDRPLEAWFAETHKNRHIRHNKEHQPER